MQNGHLTSGVFNKKRHSAMAPSFGLRTKIQNRLRLVTFPLIFNALQHAFKDTFSKARGPYLSVQLTHKSSRTKFIPLNLIDNFIKCTGFVNSFFGLLFALPNSFVTV